MEIRQAEQRDIDVLVEFNINNALETEGKVLTPEAYRGVVYLFENPSKGVFYVAEINNEVVGCLMITLQWVDYRAMYIYFIQNVYTRAEFRGRGIFKALYAHVFAIAQAKSIALRLYADNDNQRAIDIYKKIGMLEVNAKMLTIDFAFKH